MLEARFRALPKWQEPPKLLRRKAPFGTTFVRTLDLLERELRYLRARDIIIEAGFEPDQIRNDGWPRSGATAKHPGVVLYFEGKTGAMRMPSAGYNTWQSNLHAIALTLERLRAIDRYGVTMGQEQYQGFKALPAPEQPKATWSLDEAATWLAARTPWVSGARDLLSSETAYRRAYRESAAALHPDSGGAIELFHALQDVNALFEQHFRKA